MTSILSFYPQCCQGSDLMVWDKMHTHMFTCKTILALTSWKFVWVAYFLSELCGGVSQCDLEWGSDTACNKFMRKSLKYLQTPACSCPNYKDLEQVLTLFICTWVFFFHLKFSGTEVRELHAWWNLIQKYSNCLVLWHVIILQAV